MVFKESGFSFDFPDDDWQIIRFDQHRYFKILSGAGLKGVDFLGIYQKKRLVFIEVKHFRTPAGKPFKPYPILTNTTEFVQQIEQKYLDSVRLLNIVYQYLRRKWWFRWFEKGTSAFSDTLFQKSSTYFWRQAYLLSQMPEKCQLNLFLEINPYESTLPKNAFFEKVEGLLAGLLEKEVGKVVVGNSKDAFK
ncbi:MAG: hypothetical protein AAF960_20195 [Bacteroidota bacterium]